MVLICLLVNNGPHLLGADGLYAHGPREDLLEGPELLHGRGIPHLLKVRRDVLVWFGDDTQVPELIVGHRGSLVRHRHIPDGQKEGGMKVFLAK